MSRSMRTCASALRANAHATTSLSVVARRTSHVARRSHVSPRRVAYRRSRILSTASSSSSSSSTCVDVVASIVFVAKDERRARLRVKARVNVLRRSKGRATTRGSCSWLPRPTKREMADANGCTARWMGWKVNELLTLLHGWFKPCAWEWHRTAPVHVLVFSNFLAWRMHRTDGWASVDIHLGHPASPQNGTGTCCPPPPSSRATTCDRLCARYRGGTENKPSRHWQGTLEPNLDKHTMNQSCNGPLVSTIGSHGREEAPLPCNEQTGQRSRNPCKVKPWHGPAACICH